MQNNTTFRPSKRYLIKLYLNSLLPTLFVFGFGVILLPIAPSTSEINWVIGVTISLVLVIQIVTLVIVSIIYNSIIYQIHNDAIIVRSGILTRTVEHVPFCTITNITTTRDLLDQIIGIGSLSIQTAGSGSELPELELIGIQNINVLYEFVAKEIRQVSNGLSPTQS